MQQAILYSASIHAIFFIILIFLSPTAKKIAPKHYYIDFIGHSKIETVQNPDNTNKEKSISDIKHNSSIKKKEENFDKDDFFQDSTPLKPSLATLTPQIFNQKQTQSKGEENTAFNGINTDSDFPYPWYITQLREMLWEAWIKRMPTSNTLKCIIKFKITRNGDIMKAEIEKSSGNRLFDNAAFSAVESIENFPPLPDDFFEDSLTIHVEFKNTAI